MYSSRLKVPTYERPSVDVHPLEGGDLLAVRRSTSGTTIWRGATIKGSDSPPSDSLMTGPGSPRHHGWRAAGRHRRIFYSTGVHFGVDWSRRPGPIVEDTDTRKFYAAEAAACVPSAGRRTARAGSPAAQPPRSWPCRSVRWITPAPCRKLPSRPLALRTAPPAATSA